MKLENFKNKNFDSGDWYLVFNILRDNLLSHDHTLAITMMCSKIKKMSFTFLSQKHFINLIDDSISLIDELDYISTIIHETLHALGFNFKLQEILDILDRNLESQEKESNESELSDFEKNLPRNDQYRNGRKQT